MLYAEATDESTADVLFSGQNGLPGLIDQHASYTIGTLVLLMACKGVAYAVSLSSFRGGPVFPAMYLGAAGGIALSNLPGMGLVPAIAMGIGALAAVLLRLPLTSVLVATLLMGADGIGAMPVVIVAVVVAFVASPRFVPRPAPETEPAPAPRPVAQVSAPRWTSPRGEPGPGPSLSRRCRCLWRWRRGARRRRSRARSGSSSAARR
jgi:hypothetical protein